MSTLRTDAHAPRTTHAAPQTAGVRMSVMSREARRIYQTAMAGPGVQTTLARRARGSVNHRTSAVASATPPTTSAPVSTFAMVRASLPAFTPRSVVHEPSALQTDDAVDLWLSATPPVTPATTSEAAPIPAAA